MNPPPVPMLPSTALVDAEFAALSDRFKNQYPAGLEGIPQHLWLRIAGEKWRWDSEAYLTFYRANPHDPRRFEAAWWFLNRRPNYIVGFKPFTGERPAATDFIIDEPAVERWKQHAAELKAALAEATGLPDYIQKEVDREKNFAKFQLKPVTMAFTAVDGREFDLAKMRGKVVLVDFWATWCGPCKAEVPNVVATYQKYRAHGFEVVGISLDRPEDRQKLIDYTAAHGMEWPQFFDGGGWKNQFTEDFAVRGIPAMFLIDQAGFIAATNARGETLGREVRRLLKLDAG